MFKRIVWWIAFIANTFATAAGVTLLFSEALIPGSVPKYGLTMVLLIMLFLVSGWTAIQVETN